MKCKESKTNVRNYFLTLITDNYRKNIIFSCNIHSTLAIDNNTFVLSRHIFYNKINMYKYFLK